VTTHRFNYVVRVHEMGADYRLRPYHICSYYQDAIARHYADLGLAAYDLQRENRTWMLSAMRVDYTGAMPAWRTEVTVELWTRAIRRVRLYSDFRVTSESGERVALGTGCWLIVDQGTRRPVPLDRVASKIDVHQDAVYVNHRFRRIDLPEGEATSLAQVILQHDTDFNHHLNNLRYLVLSLEALPPEYQQKHALQTLEIGFLDEAFLGDTITSTAVRHDHTAWHRLTRGKDGMDICRMKSVWRPRTQGGNCESN
jgi:acyl-ACP thioesterase